MFKPWKKESNGVVYITDRARNKLSRMIMMVTTEVSGLGRVVEIDGRTVITDVFYFDQTNSGGSTVLSQASVGTFLTNWVMDGGDPRDIRFWWHSHASMGVYWSGTDEDNIRRLSKDMKDPLVSIVGNRQGKFKVRTDLNGRKKDDLELVTIPHKKVRRVVNHS